MAAWSSLPPELKQEIVKKLDFMGRHALRNTSRLDRKIVDSTKLVLPRVRFGYKEGKGLIVVYTGIDKFLRLEFVARKNGINILIFENNYTMGVLKELPLEKNQTSTENLLTIMHSIFKCLLIQPSISIRFTEFEVSVKDDEAIVYAVIMQIHNAMEERLGVIVTCGELPKNEELIILSPAGPGRCLKGLSLVVGGDSMVPLIAVDSVTKESLLGQSVYFMKKVQKIPRYDRFNNMLTTIRVPLSGFQYKKSHVDKGALVHFETTNECGQWIQTVSKQDEKYYQKELQSPKCALGDLCERCADPFDYWYIQNLPRRIYHEPFWNKIFIRLKHLGIDYDEEMEKLEDRIFEDEDKKESRNDVLKSWGFRMGEPMSNPAPTTVTINYFKYLAIFFVFLVSIAIFSYFLWF